MRNPPLLTGHERTFNAADVIVTKTDLTGRITYANRIFLGISQLTQNQALNAPHNLIRHPHMPRCVFKLLWERIAAGKETFAYVINRAMSGDHYWVFAHVTPSYSESGELTGYHSNRRVPNKSIIESTIQPLYDKLCSIEKNSSGRKDGMSNAYDALNDTLKAKGVDYDRFIFSL